MARRQFLVVVAILLCRPVLSGAYSFLGGVPEAARALEAHRRFNQLVAQMNLDLAAGNAAGFVEMDHGAGADTGRPGILGWAVGSVCTATLVALAIGLAGGEQEPLPAIRTVTPSHEITHLGLYLVVLLVCIPLVYIGLRAALRQLE